MFAAYADRVFGCFKSCWAGAGPLSQINQVTVAHGKVTGLIQRDELGKDLGEQRPDQHLVMLNKGASCEFACDRIVRCAHESDLWMEFVDQVTSLLEQALVLESLGLLVTDQAPIQVVAVGIKPGEGASASDQVCAFEGFDRGDQLRNGDRHRSRKDVHSGFQSATQLKNGISICADPVRARLAQARTINLVDFPHQTTRGSGEGGTSTDEERIGGSGIPPPRWRGWRGVGRRDPRFLVSERVRKT